MKFCRKTILLLIFSSFISVGWGQDCDEGFVWIDDPPLNEYNWDGYNCFYELDLNVLSEFIQLNSSLSGQHLDIGWQYWVNGRLEGLTLYALQLTSIPNNIGSLNNLTYLNLHFNQITNIPETIGELTQLTEIYLENNLFGILPESIGNLTNLITLNINENQLTSIPENIGNLTGLEKLLLYNNSLTSLPESICNIFSNLSQYDFSDNYICPPYPYCIENVGYQDTSDCEELSLCDEGYIEIDGECYYQSDLDVLQQFIDNSQEGENPPPYNMTPLELGEQVWENGRLVEFECSTVYPTYLNYELSGSIPVGLSGLNELTKLYINANELINIPNDIGNLTNLKLLELSGNNFSSLPGSIGNLFNLEWLYIYNNQITFLPESLCNILDNLSNISMEYNLLCSGTYPDCLEEYLSVQDTSNCYEVCEEFAIEDFQMIADTEFGNQLIVYLSVPDIELYAPDFILQTDDEYFYVTDPIASFFFVTGPEIVDLHYNYEYEYYPENHHLFSGNINIVTGDNTLTCNLPFNEIIFYGILGDLNNDNSVDILDVIILVNHILSPAAVELDGADINGDGEVNILDVVALVNIILSS